MAAAMTASGGDGHFQGHLRDPPRAPYGPDHCLGEGPGTWTTLREQGVPGECGPGWGSASERGHASLRAQP